MEAENILSTLASSDNPVIAILAFMVIVLAGVVVAQWRYTIYSTVPKWAWDELNGSIKELVKLVEKLDTILEIIVTKKVK